MGIVSTIPVKTFQFHLSWTTSMHVHPVRRKSSGWDSIIAVVRLHSTLLLGRMFVAISRSQCVDVSECQKCTMGVYDGFSSFPNFFLRSKPFRLRHCCSVFCHKIEEGAGRCYFPATSLSPTKCYGTLCVHFKLPRSPTLSLSLALHLEFVFAYSQAAVRSYDDMVSSEVQVEGARLANIMSIHEE